jgi:hypothetical protein
LKIMLVGEVSGVHRELRAGLGRLGHEITQAHTGDTYRRFDADITYEQVTADARRAPLTFAKQLSTQLKMLSGVRGYDVVQFISAKFIHWRLQQLALPLLRKQNGAVVMVNVSCSAEFNRFMRDQTKTPCAECKRFDLTNGACPWEQEHERRFEERVYRSASALVATHHWYFEPLRRLNLDVPIFRAALPIDLEGVQVNPPRTNGPLRVYYGETRHGFKGGEHIVPAIEDLARTHPDDFEFVRTSRIAFKDYLRRLDECDVLIDQANAAGMGMNAVYAMARGKVTLTGAETEELEFLDAAPAEAPMVNVRPSAEQIRSQLLSLLDDREATRARGLASRAFVERFNSADVVARRFVSVYEQVRRS